CSDGNRDAISIDSNRLLRLLGKLIASRFPYPPASVSLPSEVCSPPPPSRAPCTSSPSDPASNPKTGRRRTASPQPQDRPDAELECYPPRLETSRGHGNQRITPI